MTSTPGLTCDLLLRSVLEGTEDHVQLALDRYPLDVNKQGAHEATPLHIAVSACQSLKFWAPHGLCQGDML